MGFWQRQWDEKREAQEQLRASGKCSLVRVKNRFQVVVPDNAAFKRDARIIGGRWLIRTERWSFPSYCYPMILRIIHQHFGKDALKS